MIKEEAIKRLKEARTTIQPFRYVDEAIDYAIKTLEQESCDDCISRQEVLEQTSNWSKDEFLRVTNPFDYLRTRINSLSPVIPKQKIGHWIYAEKYSDWYDATYECSCCKRPVFISQEARDAVYKAYPYCHCGTKMIKPQEEVQE